MCGSVADDAFRPVVEEPSAHRILVLLVLIILVVFVSAVIVAGSGRDATGDRRDRRRRLRRLLGHLHGDLRALLDLAAAGRGLFEDLLLIVFVGLDLFGLARELVLIAFEGLAGLLGRLAGDIGDLDET